MIVKSVTMKSENSMNGVDDDNDENTKRYKEMIREQDKKCTDLSEENEKLKDQLKNYAIDLEELRKYMYDMQQQNAELKLQVN